MGHRTVDSCERITPIRCGHAAAFERDELAVYRLLLLSEDVNRRHVRASGRLEAPATGGGEDEERAPFITRPFPVGANVRGWALHGIDDLVIRPLSDN
jgi:hypothetical protein